MKIKPSVNRNVNTAVTACREVIEKETIGLLKMLGLSEWEDLQLGRVMFLYQPQAGGQSETLLVNRVSYHKDRDGTMHVGTSFYSDGKFSCCRTSRYDSLTGLSLSNLLLVFEEVKKSVRKR